MFDGAQSVLIALALSPALHGLSSSTDQVHRRRQLHPAISTGAWCRIVGDRSRSQLSQQVSPCGTSSLMCRLEGIAPRLSQKPVWVPVTHPVTLEELARELSIDETQLAWLNKVDEDHRFDKGEWVALPSREVAAFFQGASLDTSAVPSVPPQQMRHVSNTPIGVVHSGDTLIKIAQRYGLSIAELLRLNPGLEEARLVVGSQIRLVQSTPLLSLPPVLGLSPVANGGGRRAELIEVSRSTSTASARTTDAQATSYPSVDDLVPEGVLTSSERVRTIRIRSFLDLPVRAQAREACSSGALSFGECYSSTYVRRPLPLALSPLGPVSIFNAPSASSRNRPTRQAALQRIRESRIGIGVPRTFGSCTYRWDSWRLVANDVRTTTYSCGQSGAARYTVGVSCTKLKLNQFLPSDGLDGRSVRWTWSAWRDPAAGGEEEMVAALCANLRGAI